MNPESDLAPLAARIARGESPDASELRAALEHDDPIVALEHTLSLAEDPRITALAHDRALPDPVVEELVRAFGALIPSLGARATGGLRALTAQARRLLDAARRKDAIVRDRLATLDGPEAVGLLARYLETSPAPGFTRRLEADHPELVAAARDLHVGRTDPDACFGPDADLAELLRRPTGDASLAGRLAALAARLEHPRAACAAAMTRGTRDQILIAASLITFLRLRDDCDHLLARFLESSPDAPALGAAAASLDPAKTRQALSLMLADSAWGNPEEPEHQMTLDRARALVAARSILPSVGSPAPPIRIEELGARLRAHRIDDVPGAVDAHLARWRSLLPD